MQSNGTGIYVHIPFCRFRCDYCAFITYTDKDHLIDDYVNACVEQLAREVAHLDTPADTLYLGGGTPSRLSADQVSAIVHAASLSDGSEVSIECNPEDVSADLLLGYRLAGVTRASFGVQSTSARVLESLGRPESPVSLQFLASAVASSGLQSWNIDLIYGASAETFEDFQVSVETVLSLTPAPPHLSAYALTVEAGTPLSRTPERHPDEDRQADRYEWLTKRLGAAGFDFEEISSWALPGHTCRHHERYWSGGNYLGIGAGAHGHRDGHRYWNTVSPERYISMIGSGDSPIAGEEFVQGQRQVFEMESLLLRTASGVDWDALDHEALAHKSGRHVLIERKGDRAVLTIEGRLLANQVILCLKSSC